MTASSFLEWLVSVSMQGGVLVLLILGVKAVFGRLFTPWWHFSLWLLVLARLMVPTGPESVLSLSNYVGPSRWATQASDGPKSLRGFLPVNGGSEPEAAGGAPVQTEVTSADAPKITLRFSFDAGAVVLAVWGLGTLAALVLLAGSVVQLLATIRRARLTDDPEMLALFKGCCIDVGIHRRVELRQSDEISTPVLAGLFRPVVLLPGGTAATTTAAELRFILLHELIHLRRGDLLVGCAAALLQAVHWFNPLIWIGFYRMRADREIACDAEVVKLLGRDRAADYGRTILKLAEHASAPRFFAGSIGIIEVKSEIGRRIIMISQHRKQGRARAICGLVIATIIAAVSFTEAQSEPAEPEAPQAIQTIAVPDSDSARSSGQQPQQIRNSDTNAGTTTATLGSLLNPAASAPVAKTPIIIDGMEPFTLNVDENAGELIYKFDEKTKALESITAIKGAIFSVDGTTISGTAITYKLNQNELVAKGPELSVQIQRGSVNSTATADRLVYNTETGGMNFQGNVLILRVLSSGEISEITGENIKISPGDDLKMKSEDGYKMTFPEGGQINMNGYYAPMFTPPIL